jgi:hypothetical protein
MSLITERDGTTTIQGPVVDPAALPGLLPNPETRACRRSRSLSTKPSPLCARSTPESPSIR